MTVDRRRPVRRVVQLWLEAPSAGAVEHALRMILKRLLRDHNTRCRRVRIRDGKPPPETAP